MIDIKNIESYRENNQLEAKKSAGGLPGSLKPVGKFKTRW